jgi:hypothetical protein
MDLVGGTDVPEWLPEYKRSPVLPIRGEPAGDRDPVRWVASELPSQAIKQRKTATQSIYLEIQGESRTVKAGTGRANYQGSSLIYHRSLTARRFLNGVSR